MKHEASVKAAKEAEAAAAAAAAKEKKAVKKVVAGVPKPSVMGGSTTGPLKWRNVPGSAAPKVRFDMQAAISIWLTSCDVRNMA